MMDRDDTSCSKDQHALRESYTRPARLSIVWLQFDYNLGNMSQGRAPSFLKSNDGFETVSGDASEFVFEAEGLVIQPRQPKASFASRRCGGA